MNDRRRHNCPLLHLPPGLSQRCCPTPPVPVPGHCLCLPLTGQNTAACVPATCSIAEVLEHAAYLGMSAMLVGPLFAPDVRNPQVRGSERQCAMQQSMR